MPTINSENAKNIRTPFEVHCGLSKLTDEVLSFSGSGAKVMGTSRDQHEPAQAGGLVRRRAPAGRVL